MWLGALDSHVSKKETGLPTDTTRKDTLEVHHIMSVYVRASSKSRKISDIPRSRVSTDTSPSATGVKRRAN